jgi:hypothetical protein
MGRLEQWAGRVFVPTRAEQAPSFEVDACSRDVDCPGKLGGLFDEGVASVEVPPETLHPSELRENLGATGIRLLSLELGAEAFPGAGEVVEVPQGP